MSYKTINPKQFALDLSQQKKIATISIQHNTTKTG